MIRIEAPYLRREAERTFLCAGVTLNGKRTEVWYSVEKEFEHFLVEDRADAFAVGLLTVALRLGEDLVCDAPLTRRLHHQLNAYLIPAMTANMKVYQSISVRSPLTDAPLPCEKAVATGWTGGVDCMYTLMNHRSAPEPSRRLTHLVVANVGTLESRDNAATLAYMTEKARKGVAADMGLTVVSIDSNLQLLHPEKYLSVAAFRLPSAILALQKLFGVYLNSAGYDFAHFHFDPNNSAYYELLPLSCFETDTTVFYSSGGQTPRIRKLEALSDFPPARKYLHPCIYAKRDNCGKCGKCVRTLGGLFAIGQLEQFRAVFDVDGFYRDQEDILANILCNSENSHCAEVLAELKRQGFTLSDQVRRKAHIRRVVMMAQKRHENK